MADTFTTSLSIRQIETGTRSGTWGTETNTQYELFDNAFSYVANDLASDADATLTISDGTASNARYFYIKFTSSVSLTATRTITLAPDDSKKIWIVENATTGSQSLTFKQGSSGSTVTVSNGNTAMIYADGAGATNGAIENVLSNIQISDSIDLVGSTPTLTIGDAGAEDAKLVFDGNAQDFYIGLDDSADDLVIGVGSTVGTTPAIVIDENQNVGIGVTPGQNFNLQDTGAVEARFRSTDNDCFLQISSDTDEGQDSVLQFLSGTSGRGSITYDHNPTAADQSMIFKTGDNAVSAMTIDGSGNVGIGITNPSCKLNVVDTSSADATVLRVGNGYTTDAANDASTLMFQLYRSYSAGINDSGFIKSVKEQAWDASDDRDSALVFGTRDGASNPAERMRITSAGRVGIGTSSPSSYYSDRLVVTAGNENGITIANTGTTGTQYLMFADGTSGNAAYRGYMGYSHTSEELIQVSHGIQTFYSGTSPTEVARLTTNKHLQLSNGSGLHTDTLRSADNNVTSTFSTVLDFSTTGGVTAGRGYYLVTVVREGASVGTAIVLLVGLSTGSAVIIYNTISANSLVAQASGGNLQIRSTGGDAICHATAIPIGITGLESI